MAEDVKQSGDPQQQQPVPEADADKEGVIERASQGLAKQPKGLRDQIQSTEFFAAVKAIAPKGVTRAERVVRMLLTAITRTPELAECSKPSFFRACLDLTAYGLEADGRRAHLIPFRNKKMCQCGHEMDVHRGQDCSKCGCRQRRTLIECQLIIDYKGIAELVRRSGDVRLIHADVVYEKDEWSYAYGTDAHLRHKPNLKDRGEGRIAFYSYVRLKDGSEDFVVLSPTEVEKVRKRSKAADAGPWVTDYDEMGKKTAFRRHSKWLPLSAEVRSAVEHDEEAVDISGWEELLEPEQQQETLPPAGHTLKDRLMSKEEPKA
jgi:recombination protein RecT